MSSMDLPELQLVIFFFLNRSNFFMIIIISNFFSKCIENFQWLLQNIWTYKLTFFVNVVKISNNDKLQ